MPAANKQIKCLAVINKNNSSILSDILTANFNGCRLSVTSCDIQNIAAFAKDRNNYNLCLFFPEKENVELDCFSELRSTVSFPLIVILQNVDYKLSYSLLRAGADDCVFMKDFTSEELTRILDKRSFNWNLEANNNVITESSAAETISHLFKHTKLGVAVFNKSGRMLDCNSSLQNMFGFNKKQLLNMMLEDICKVPDSQDIKYEKLNNLNNKYLELEKPFFNSAGELVYCRIFLTVVKENRNVPEIIMMMVSDITLRKIIQQELEKEKYFLQTLLDNIPDAIYFKNAEHRFIKVSKYVHLKGLTNPEDAIGKTDFDFFSEEHANEAYQDEQNIIKTGQPVINKIEKETFPDGQTAWVSTTKAPLFDKDMNVTGIVGISRDITDLKINEEALLKSEERYRNLIEYSPDTIAILLENRFVFINSAGLNLLKVSLKDELEGLDIREFIAPQYRTSVSYFLEKVLKNKKPVKALKTKLRRIDGELLEAEMTGIPITYSDKPAIQIIIRDITDIKKQEKIQQTTLNLLKASNYANTTEELFRYIHQAVRELMPARNFYIAIYDEKTEMLSFPYFIDEEDERMASKKLGKGLTEYVLRTGKAHLISEKMDNELRNKGDVELIGAPAKVWLGVPLQVRDKTIGVMVVQDYNNEKAYSRNDKQTLELISFSVSRAIERKMTEEEILNYVQQLKEINATKDRFFSYISHDLRSPFSSLLGFAELVVADFDNLSSQEVKRYLEIIGATSRNLYNLLNNLLQFTRFQTGRIQFAPKPLHLHSLIHDVYELLKGNMLRKELAFINETCSDIHVFADEEMIISAIQNLLSNAVKFTPRRGKITLSCIINKDKNEVEVWVADTGLGMDKETIERLFRIEVIQTTSGTEKESGTGLGLILAKESIEKNNGKIWVESTPGTGTTFKFTLPLASNS